MSKIVIRGQFPFRPGKAEQGKAAARSLRERVLREDKGVLLYEFFVDESDGVLVMTEAYADEPSLISHINASDFSSLFEALDFPSGHIAIHGNPSGALRKKLDAFGPFDLFPTI